MQMRISLVGHPSVSCMPALHAWVSPGCNYDHSRHPRSMSFAGPVLFDGRLMCVVCLCSRFACWLTEVSCYAFKKAQAYLFL